MPTKVTLYPVYMLANALDDGPFDRSLLPIEIAEGVCLERVSPMLNNQTFDWARNQLGKRNWEHLQSVEYALVHRYESDLLHGGLSDQQSEKLVRYLAACLRLVRPMRQSASLIRGKLREDGTLDVEHFEHPIDLVEVPVVQKLFHLRNRDVELLRVVANDFLRALRGEFWKFRMAVEFHEAGHFQDQYWKARYLLWCSAVEAIFTSHDRDHRGSPVATERIKWFLGAHRSIYEPGDIPNYLPQPNITVNDVVDDMYRVRNFIAHGDRIPDNYFHQTMRQGVNGALNVLEVLLEAVSFVARKSLLRILQDNLLDHFASAAASEAYFGGHNLTLTQIRRRQQQIAGTEE